MLRMFLYSDLQSPMAWMISIAGADKVTLPTTLGSHRVDVSSIQLVDYKRQDPYAPTLQPRKLMISVLSPVPKDASCALDATVPYMIPPVAAFEDHAFAPYGVPNGTFSRPQLPVCRNSSSTLHYDYNSAENFH
jgi:hypothetical protein